MIKYLTVILTLLLGVQNLPAPVIPPSLSGELLEQNQQPIDPSDFFDYLNVQENLLQTPISFIQPNQDLKTLNDNIKLIISQASKLYDECERMLQNPLTDEARTKIQTIKMVGYSMISSMYSDMLYKGENFVYVSEDANFIILRSNNANYRFKKSAVTNLSAINTPATTQALQYAIQKKTVSVGATVTCQSGSANISCIKFPQIVKGNTVVDMVGPVSISYDLKAAAAAISEDAQKAALQAKVPSIYPYTTIFQGIISALTPAGDNTLILTLNNTKARHSIRSDILNAPNRLVFKISDQDLNTPVYVANIFSSLREIISLAGSTMVGKEIDIMCQSKAGCPYDEDSHAVSGSFTFDLRRQDGLEQLLIAKRNAAAMKFTTSTYKLLNAAGSYIRFKDDAGNEFATLKKTITNLTTLQRYEKVINVALTNPTQYPLPMTLTCAPNTLCSKKEVKDSAGKLMGIEIVGTTTIAMNPQDIRKIQGAMAALRKEQVVPGEAQSSNMTSASNAATSAPNAAYKTFGEFRDALYKVRGNPQVIEGIFKQVLDDMNRGRIPNFVAPNGMFDLGNLDLDTIPESLPQLFYKSGAVALNLSKNKLSNIQGLAKIPTGRLRVLHLYDNNNLTSLAPLASQALETLIAFNTSVSREMPGLTVFSRGPSSQTLKELSVDNTGLRSITFLLNFQNLSKLSVRYNPVVITSNQIDVNTLKKLQNRGVQILVK